LKRLITAAAVASGVVLISTTSALASLVTISGPSPYASCTTNAGTHPGTNFASGEVEPQVAANPANSLNIIASFQQDRWSNGGAHGLAVGFSKDGGATWGERTTPFSICTPNAIIDPFTGAPYDRASDPWTSIGPDGVAYTVGLLATNTSVAGAGNNDTGVAAVTSRDGGASWDDARLIKSDQGTPETPFEFTKFFNDKESVTADPTANCTAYVVWDRLESPGNNPDSVVKAKAFRGPTWFSKTSDCGLHWSPARPIFDPGSRSQTIGNEIVVDPRTGTLYDFFDLFTSAGSKPLGDHAAVITSTDHGATWSGATVISDEQDVADVDPNTGQLLRTGGGLPSAAIDATTGQLYVTWTDSRFVGGAFNQVVISTSIDGGATWSAPAVVSTSTTRPSFTQTVAVLSNGTVGVTFYDLRELAAGNTTTLPTDYWLKTSPPGGGSFSSETKVAGPFNLLVAPNAGGFFLGDYEGLATIGTTFHPVFVQVNCSDSSCAEPNDPTDVATAAI
jgi:hypothetical protein